MNAIDFVLADIAGLEHDGHISEELAQRGREVVGLIFQENTVYASIGPIDDGDLSFYWVAGDWAISIDLYGGMPNTYGWYRARQGETTKTHTGGAPKWMWHALREFSERVEQLNPAWREQRTAEVLNADPA